MSGIGGYEAGGGDVVAHTFTGSCTMMMSTNGEDGTLASKLCQQHHQAAPMAAPPYFILRVAGCSVSASPPTAG